MYFSGRFGNQADHFLGSLRFAHSINRTLVLPPWVEYRQGELNSRQIPFDTYFQVHPLSKFHRVITMENFMKFIAPEIWPPDQRIAFCYAQRDSLNKKIKNKSCNAKEGNPFGPFWNTFRIDFIGSEFFGPLTYDVFHQGLIDQWNEKYPANEWPVLAFTGAPANFPVKEENRQLHKYLIWSHEISNKAKQFISLDMAGKPFIGIHLRNGIDWIRACDHIKNSPNLFSAAQCVGYRNEKGNATMEMCFPSRELIIKQLRQEIKKSKRKSSTNGTVEAIFVASDNNFMIDDLNKIFHRFNVTAYRYPQSNPHVDLAILGMSNHLIANCISSFSAFAVREREINGLPTTFWGFSENEQNSIKKKESTRHEEL